MLFEQISEDIIKAMKAKDKVRLMSLRNIKKYFIEAKSAPGANDELSDDTALKIISKLAKQGRDAAAVYIQQNRQDLADEELQQVAFIEEYLPKQLTAEELKAKLQSVKLVTNNTNLSRLVKPVVLVGWVSAQLFVVL